MFKKATNSVKIFRLSQSVLNSQPSRLKLRFVMKFLIILGFCVAACYAGSTVINDGKYMLTTSVSSGSTLTVTITAETTGYIGFGISPTGGMTGADIAIGGFTGFDGEPYLRDYFGTGNTAPTLDTIQSLQLISASENLTHTTLSFSRPLDTGDVNHDLVVENKNQFVIWSIGKTDDVEYHQNDRGTVEINLMAP